MVDFLRQQDSKRCLVIGKPTAELIAGMILSELAPFLDVIVQQSEHVFIQKVKLVRVSVWETPTCCAT